MKTIPGKGGQEYQAQKNYLIKHRAITLTFRFHFCPGMAKRIIFFSILTF